MDLETYKKNKHQFLSGDYSVESYFMQNNLLLEYSYLKLLQGEVDVAEKFLKKICEFDFRADWALKLIQFIRGYVSVAPSYFQIRNFLEIDLDLLIRAGQVDFAENIINGADIFYSVNPESYKFIARVMFNNGFSDLALLYLNKAKDKFYYDPEMHFMFAVCFKERGELLAAKESVQNCLNILPGYFPAKNLLDSLNCEQ